MDKHNIDAQKKLINIIVLNISMTQNLCNSIKAHKLTSIIFIIQCFL